jgi:hypothetical protein
LAYGIGGFDPDEWLRVVVVGLYEGGDIGLEMADTIGASRTHLYKMR